MGTDSSGQRGMGSVETLRRVLRAGKAGTLGRDLGRSSNSARKAVSDSLHSMSWPVKRGGRGASWATVLSKGDWPSFRRRRRPQGINLETHRQTSVSESRTPPNVTCRFLFCRCGRGLSLRFYQAPYPGVAEESSVSGSGDAAILKGEDGLKAAGPARSWPQALLGWRPVPLILFTPGTSRARN